MYIKTILTWALQMFPDVRYYRYYKCLIYNCIYCKKEVLRRDVKGRSGHNDALNNVHKWTQILVPGSQLQEKPKKAKF